MMNGHSDMLAVQQGRRLHQAWPSHRRPYFDAFAGGFGRII